MAIPLIHNNGSLIVNNSTSEALPDASNKARDLAQNIIQTLHDPTTRAQNINSLKARFSAIDTQDLHHVLQNILQGIDINDLITATKLLAEVLPQNAVEGAIQASKGNTSFDGLKKAKKYLWQAQEWLKNVQKTSPSCTSAIQTTLIQIRDAFMLALKNVLAALGIADLFQVSDNDDDAQYKGGKIMQIAFQLDIIGKMLIPGLGEHLAAVAIGIGSIVIMVLSLIFPHIQGAPSALPGGAQNWTRRIAAGELSVQGQRDEYVNRIYNVFSSAPHNKCPLLVGESGVGKTETIKAFAAACLQGKFKGLEGKQVFYFNTQDLVQSREAYGANRILERIRTAMGRHRQDIILVFDEIHNACQKSENSALYEQLKTLIDDKTNGFPFLIGITTKKACKKIMNEARLSDNAFGRRFDPIIIENMDEKNTARTLYQRLVQTNPQIIHSHKDLKYIFKRTTEVLTEQAPQPLTSLNILSRAFEECKKSEKTALATQHTEDAQMRLQRLVKNKKLLESIQTIMYTSILKIDEQERAPRDARGPNMTYMNVFLLLKYYIRPLLNTRIQEDGTELNVHTALSRDFINTIIDAERKDRGLETEPTAPRVRAPQIRPKPKVRRSFVKARSFTQLHIRH